MVTPMQPDDHEAEPPVEIDAAFETQFLACLKQHLAGHLQPFILGITFASVQVVNEMREQVAAHDATARRYLEEAAALRLEVSKLAAIVTSLSGADQIDRTN